MKTTSFNGHTFDEATYEVYLRGELRRRGIPDSDDGLILYITHGAPLGSFLAAVVSNDLREACARADEPNARALTTIVRFLYNCAPLTCWGSPAIVQRWREHRGLWGLPWNQGPGARMIVGAEDESPTGWEEG